MKLSDLSDFHLALVIAGATFLGGISSSLIGVFMVDAGTNRETDVQLVQVAINILSSTEATTIDSPEKVLRTWAVDTINAVAEVQLDDEARELLINGEVSFSSAKASSLYNSMTPRQRQISDLIAEFYIEPSLTPEPSDDGAMPSQ